MKHHHIALVILAIVVVSSVAVATDYVSSFDFPRRYGVERVTHYDPRVNYERMDTTVYLEPYQFDKGQGSGRGGYDPIYPRGTARVRSNTYYGYPRSSVKLSVKDIPASEDAGGVYEAWLVDENTEYRLSLGTFYTVRGGSGVLDTNMNNYLNAYDTLEITLEPYSDVDPLPGPVVLIGAIAKTYDPYFNPQPKQSMMMTDSIKTY